MPLRNSNLDNGKRKTDSGRTKGENSQAEYLPSIALPKGGGEIRGFGNKIAVNTATGSGSMTIPIVTSPERSSFRPRLSLSYDSGVENRPFGLGLSRSLPFITRKTDRGVTAISGHEHSDVFILSEAKDPVLVYRLHPGGSEVAAHSGHPRDFN